MFSHNVGHAWPIVLDVDPHSLLYCSHTNGNAAERTFRFRSGVDCVVELRSFLTRLRERMPTLPPGELMRMLEWAEARLERLEGKLTGEGIFVALQEQELFPEIDILTAPDLDEE